MNIKYILLLLCLLCCGAASSAPYRQKVQSTGQIAKLLPEEISKFVRKKYPDATILWFEKQSTGYKVGIQDADMSKKIEFGKEHLWLTTVWEISPADVPENVLYALQDEAYDPSGIEQATVIETPEDVYYSLKLKQANHAVEIKIDALGKIIP